MGGLSTILMFVVMIGLIFIMQRQQKKTSTSTSRPIKHY